MFSIRECYIVPTLCVGMHPMTLRVKDLCANDRTRSVRGSVPTQSVGTIMYMIGE